jgi:hypothetical protein
MVKRVINDGLEEPEDIVLRELLTNLALPAGVLARASFLCLKSYQFVPTTHISLNV